MSYILMNDQMNTWNNGMGDNRYKDQQDNSDVDSGDLRAWEFLTRMYDDEQFFAADHSSMQANERSKDQQHHDHSVSTNNTRVATSKRSNSDATSYLEISERIDRSKRMMTHSTSNPDMLQNHQSLHHFLDNNVPSYRTEGAAHSSSIDPTQIRINTLSHSLLQKQNWLPSVDASVSVWQQECVRSSYHTDEHAMISDLPAHTSVSNVGKNERSQLTTALVDDYRHNFYRDHIPDEQSAFRQLSFSSLNVAHGNDINHEQYLIPARNTQTSTTVQDVTTLASPVNYFDASEGMTSVHNHFDIKIESAPCVDKKFESTSATSKHVLPPTEKLESIAQSATSNDSNVGIASAKAESPPLSSAAATNISLPCFSPVDEQLMHTWMTLQVPSMIPPYQQLRSKKLLLAPLTPYNYFFRDERENIVIHISSELDPLPPPIAEFSVSKMKSLLYQHWFIDPVKKKRQHRKSHGKINFHRLSKVIAERWHQLPSQIREFYRAVARYDDLYYHLRLDIIKQSPDIT